MPSRPIRILFCITDLHIGGAEQALVEVATRLHASTAVCHVVALSVHPPADRDRLVRRLQEASIGISFLRGHSVRHAPRVFKELIDTIRAFQPDIVQSFLHHANVMAAVAARRANRPIVVTGIRVAERRRNLHRFFAGRIDRYVAQHVCVSQAVANFAASECGLPEEKLIVIPNGVDVSRFGTSAQADFAALGVPSGGKVMVFVGRLDIQKRLEWLIERMPAVGAILPQQHVVLVGDGPERHRLARLAKQLGVDNRLHFAGWRDDIPAILAAAQMFILTSAWEGMPNALLEAMAAGLPIVATCCEGVSELLVDELADQMVATNDADGFVERIVRYTQHSDLALRLGKLNRHQAAHHSWEAVAESYAGLYHDLAERKLRGC